MASSGGRLLLAFNPAVTGDAVGWCAGCHTAG